MRAKLQENSYIEVFCVAGQDTYLVELSEVCSKLVEFTDGCRSRRTKAKPKFLFFRNSFVVHVSSCNVQRVRWWAWSTHARPVWWVWFDVRCVAYVDVAVLIVFCDDLLEST